MSTHAGDEMSPVDPEVESWQDYAFTDAPLPEDYVAPPENFDDAPPPQLVRTVNLLRVPEHDLRGPDDVDGIASFLFARAKQGVADVFAHEDYAGYEDHPTEALARAIAEHQTGIPYTMPAYFYGGQRSVAQAIVQRGRYPLVGQCQQSVTTALCIGGWDGGAYGDIGSGRSSQSYCASLGRGWTNIPTDLKKWSDELWSDVSVGSCLFWSTESDGVGHVVMVIRKHPTDRKWQLWDTGTSFHDPQVHPAATKGARMLWESHWWDYIPQTLSTNWAFRGIGLIRGLGAVRPNLRPRGRTRLLLVRRSDRRLLFRSAWVDMESANLPISWLLRALRGAPFAKDIEAKFCIDSTPGLVKDKPSGSPLLDCVVDPSGNARMFWNWQWKQGFHERKGADQWRPDAPYPDGASASSPAAAPRPERRDEPVPKGSGGALKQGARGDAVKALQEALIALGYEVKGGADGVFGKGTDEVVRRFQTDAGLTVDGVAGAGTQKAIDERRAAQART